MPYKTVKLNTARNCLKYLIRLYNIGEIYMPHYLCPVMRIAAAKEGCKVKFYHIDKNFYPTEKFPETAFVLYPNYFGICTKNTEKLEKIYPNLIVDNAHAFFNPPKGLAAFNSARKFFDDISDGAILYCRKTLDCSFCKDDYVPKAPIFDYEALCKNENRLDYEDIKYMSKHTEDFLDKIDIASECAKRREIFKKTSQLFVDKNTLKFNIDDDFTPYKYPCLISSEVDKNEVLTLCRKEKIQIFRYWNNLPDSFPEKNFYENLIVI